MKLEVLGPGIENFRAKLIGQMAQGKNYLYHGSFSGELCIPYPFHSTERMIRRDIPEVHPHHHLS